MAIKHQRLIIKNGLVFYDDGEPITPEHIIPAYKSDNIARANGMIYAEQLTKKFDEVDITVDEDFKIVEVRGEVLGIQLQNHEGMPRQAEIITGDDGDWFVSNVTFDTAWLDDLIKVAQATRELLRDGEETKRTP